MQNYHTLTFKLLFKMYVLNYAGAKAYCKIIDYKIGQTMKIDPLEPNGRPYLKKIGINLFIN